MKIESVPFRNGTNSALTQRSTRVIRTTDKRTKILNPSLRKKNKRQRKEDRFGAISQWHQHLVHASQREALEVLEARTELG